MGWIDNKFWSQFSVYQSKVTSVSLVILDKTWTQKPRFRTVHDILIHIIDDMHNNQTCQIHQWAIKYRCYRVHSQRTNQWEYMDMESQTISFEPGYMLKFMLFQLCDLDSLTLEYVFTFKTPFIVQSIHAYPCPACNKR